MPYIARSVGLPFSLMAPAFCVPLHNWYALVFCPRLSVVERLKSWTEQALVMTITSRELCSVYVVAKSHSLEHFN